MARPKGTAVNLTGNVFGRLTVLKRDGEYPSGTPLYLCECICGELTKTTSYALRNGIVISCGCYHKDELKKRAKHGLCGTKTYRCWSNMIQRCTNKKNHHYYLYGERGITVCTKWLKFENFIKDMGECPEGLSIERIDNNKGYFPDNCKWATATEQLSNRRAYRRRR